MTTADIKRLGLILAIQTEVEGMKAENIFREACGSSPAYIEFHFNEKAEELREVANKHDDQL